MMATLALAAAAVVVIDTVGFGQETIHPNGPNLDSRYTISDTTIALGDTLTIVRTLTNNESYPLTGVYLTDNLPNVFSIIDQTVTVDGSPVAYIADGPSANPVLPGFYDYRWTIDSPESTESLSRPLDPGEVLEVRYRAVSNDIGYFPLPLHATVMYGNATGMFAAEAADSVRVLVSLDTNDQEEPGPLPGSFQLVSAYPNPFNADVSIAYKGTGLTSKPIQLEIYNTAGQLVASQTTKATSDEGVLHWAPDLSTGSGIFLYRLTIGAATANGKLVLLK